MFYFNFSDDFEEKIAKHEATQDEVYEAIKMGLALVHDLFDELANLSPRGRLDTRYLSIAKTSLDTCSLFMIAEDSDRMGSSITDGLRGI